MPKLNNTYCFYDLADGGEETTFDFSDIADIYAVYNTDGEYSQEGVPSNDEYVCMAMKDGTTHVLDCPLQTTINLVRNFMRFKIGAALDLKPDKMYIRPGVNY